MTTERVEWGGFSVTEVNRPKPRREIVRDKNGNEIDYDAAVLLMNDELREEIHAVFGADGKQTFLAIYAQEHREKFGVDFAPWVGGAW